MICEKCSKEIEGKAYQSYMTVGKVKKVLLCLGCFIKLKYGVEIKNDNSNKQ